LDLESPILLTALVAIGHLSFLCPALFAAATQHIVSKFVVKELLMQVRVSMCVDSKLIDILILLIIEASVVNGICGALVWLRFLKTLTRLRSKIKLEA